MFTSKGGPNMDEMDWSPERKIVGTAVGVLLAGLLSYFTGFDPFPGFEGSVGVLVGYFVPNSK